MDKRIEQYWVGKYPNLFSGYYKGIRKSPMSWGFTCGNGWFNILDQLWKDLSKFEDLVLAQVKEKFGGLCVYTEPIDKDMFNKVHKFINNAGINSYKTCEMCGEPGRRRSIGWIFTLCDNCVKLEGSGKWSVSEEIGNKIVRELGLRTECATEKDHLMDFDHKACIVCNMQREVDQVKKPKEREKITAINCPVCEGELGEPDWLCSFCGFAIEIKNYGSIPSE